MDRNPVSSLAVDYQAIIDDVLAKEREEAERQGDELYSKPHPPATDEAIAAAEQKLERAFPESYRAFLKAANGWEHFAWGVSLFSTDDLCGEEMEGAKETLSYSEDLEDEVKAALPIGASEDNATVILLCEDGSVMRHLYEEIGRWPDMAAYLRSRIQTLNEMQQSANEANERVEREWDDDFRTADNTELVAELREAFVTHTPNALDVSAHIVADATTPNPEELVVHDDDLIAAAVDLGFVLFLGFSPTEDETLQTYRAFREVFGDAEPFKGPFEWKLASSMAFLTNTEEDPNAEPWELAIDDQGFYGLRVMMGETDEEERQNSYILNIRGIPPEEIYEDDEDLDDLDDDLDDEGLEDGEPTYKRRASFVEVLVPPTEDPAKVRALCEKLVDILPVRSGWGGYFARVRDDNVEPDPWDTVFTWCRRYMNLSPCYVDGWLGGALNRVPGCGWITVLGKPFTDAVQLDTPEGVSAHEGTFGTVYTAGELTLGDVHAGDFPHAISALAQQLESVSSTSWIKHGFIGAGGGLYFSTLATQLPGDFADHHATEGFMRRYVNPEGLLGPTPAEEAFALIERITSHLSAEQLEEYKKVTDEVDGFRDVLRAVYNAAYFASLEGASDESKALGTEALELAARYPDWAMPQVYNNLLVTYDRQDRVDDAMAMVEVALRTAEESSNSYTFHTVACLFVKAGRLDEAMHCVQRAVHHEYPLLDKLIVDDDLAALRDREEWKALFSA